MKKPTGRGINIKLVASVALCGFSVIVAVMGTMAWFSARRVSQSGNGDIQVVTPTEKFSKLSIHPCQSMTDDYLVFNKTGTGSITYNPSTKRLDYSGDTGISMGTYDLLDRHHPILLLVELNAEYTGTAADPITVHAKTEEDFIGSNVEAENPVAVDGNPLSSVVDFFSRGYNTTGFNALVSNNQINIPTSNTVQSFAKFSADGTTYLEFDNEVNLYETSADTVKYITIVFDFYETALEYIYNTFLGNEILEDRVGFVCDWEMII